jgi:hypothetical protein
MKTSWLVSRSEISSSNKLGSTSPPLPSCRCFHFTFYRRNPKGDRQIEQVDAPWSQIQPADWWDFLFFIHHIEVKLPRQIEWLTSSTTFFFTLLCLCF